MSRIVAKRLHDALSVPTYINLQDALADEPPTCTVGSQVGKTESLNAAVAGSVLMFEVMRQRKET